MKIVKDTETFVFIKPALDAHTLGINTAAELIRECGYKTFIAGEVVAKAMDNLTDEDNIKSVIEWIKKTGASRVGLSYRLDQKDAVHMVEYFIQALRKYRLLVEQGGCIEAVYFGGLPETAKIIETHYLGLVVTFVGGETAQETLTKMSIPIERMPKQVLEGSRYDVQLRDFGKNIIDSDTYQNYKPIDKSGYKEYGSVLDTLVKRIEANVETASTPLIRAHVGPYDSSKSRTDSVKEFVEWARVLADSGFLDILSIGSSQLTQSNFGEAWGERTNGGGVPVNSNEEYKEIYEAARPLLVRTYAGTKNIPEQARIHEAHLNICWHALSFWWFNQVDSRGPYDMYTNLKQHIETLSYIASTGKPFEANVPHHFAFRGADDVTYIVSAYLTAVLAKKMGVKTFILQNMLNTPRYTWGVQDLAKSRAMLKLVRSLEDKDFRVLLQTRAGLDYFKPDLYESKIQLAAVTAMMDDIEPDDDTSPQIIHVVSYSEAMALATPEIINESIKITQFSLKKYRELKAEGNRDAFNLNDEVECRMQPLYESAMKRIDGIERYVKNPYSIEGFYTIFAAGFLPTPYLWGDVAEFKYSTQWKTRTQNGGITLMDSENNEIDSKHVVEYARHNILEIENRLKSKNEVDK